MNLRERLRLRRLIREQWTAVLQRKPTPNELRQATDLWLTIHEDHYPR